MSLNNAIPPAASEAVVNFRMNHGMCPGCATQIYEVVEQDSQNNRQRLIPMSTEGVVRSGRCLFCYPDQAPAITALLSPVKLEEVGPLRPSSPSSIELIAITGTEATVATPSPFASRQTSTKDTASTCSSFSERNHARATSKKRNASGDSFPVSTTRKKDRFIPIPSFRLLPLSPPIESESELATKPPARNMKKRATKKPHLRFDNVDGSGEDEELVQMNDPPPPEKVEVRDFQGFIFEGTLLSGSIEKGVAELSFTYPEGDEYSGKTSYYKGEIAHGTFDGQGYQHDAAGCIYEGSFRRGASNGYGTCRWPNGKWVYEGEWVNDLRHGKGKCHQVGKQDGGEVYDGEWKVDMWHGEGKLKFAGGDSYKGEFREDKIQGKGVYTFSDGSVYTGNFKKDLRDGQGKMMYADGQYYEGKWKTNWREGCGKLTYTDGSVFEGTFRGDERQDGLLRMPDGIMRMVRGGQLKR